MLSVTRRRALLSFAAIASPFVSRASVRAQAPPDWRLARETEWPVFTRRFDAIGVAGALVVHDALRGGRLIANAERAKKGYLPGSTFKIPNTVIALHTGAIRDIDEETFAAPEKPFLVEGKPFLPEACAAKLNLRAAFKNSCIPAYQELARRIGVDAYKEWLTRFDYGNAEPGPDLQTFWLDGDLRISAEGQTKFLRQLIIKTLPVSPRAIALTEEIMFIEKIGDTAIHGKSGWVYSEKPAIGWWVGYAQRGEEVVMIALNLDMTRPEHAAARYHLVKTALRETGML